MTCLVYAVTSASRVPDGHGMRGEPLALVRGGGIAAVVGMVRQPPAPSQRNLRAYHRVVEEVWHEGSATIPVRYGTSFDSIDELVFVLRSRQARFRRGLALVRGRAQMTLRIVSAGNAPPQVPARPAGHEHGGGTAYLHARAAAAARARHVPELERLHSTVGQWIRAERVERTGAVVTVYHLVPRAAAARYAERVEGFAALHQVRMVVTGPFPAFAFAGDFGWNEPAS